MRKVFCFILFLFSSSPGFAVDVTTAQELQDAIIDFANTGIDTTINFSNAITIGALANLAPFLNPLCTTTAFEPEDRTITINGGDFSLSGGGSFRGLFVRAGTVAINNLTFTNMLNQGGNGAGGGGGGGAGLGGALFVADGASVILANCAFETCSARGGNGSSTTTNSGGGGGMRGTAAAGVFGAGGGGGFGGNGSTGGGQTLCGGGGGGGAKTGAGAVSGNTGGAGGNDFAAGAIGGGGAGGAASMNGETPGASGKGGGGGGGQNTGTAANGGNGGDGSFGGGGGGGATVNVTGTANGGQGGNGGFGGGGGGGGECANTAGDGGDGGDGGFGGGGGCGGNGRDTAPMDPKHSGNGGNGGFGGGGGGGGAIAGTATKGAVGRGGFPTDPITGVQTGFGGNGGLAGSGGFAYGGGGGGAGLGGAIFIQDGGELTIQGSLSFTENSVTAGTGGTMPSGGTATTSGAALGPDIFMMSGGTLIFDVSSPFTFSNVIIGNQGIMSPGVPDSSTMDGGLTKRGSSRLILLGDQTYTGTTHVEEGTLLLIGSILTDVQIDSGATLTGHFSVASDRTGLNGGDVTNAGTLAPGVGGVGTIEIEGVYTNTATGRLLVDITPDGTAHDAIVGASSIALVKGSTIEVVLNPGNYIAGTTYTIATSPVTGTFTNVVTSGAAANDVGVVVSYGSIILTITDTAFDGGQFIFPGTPTIVFETIEAGTLVPGSDFATIVEILGALGTAELNEVLVAMSPVRFGAIEWINTWNNSYVASLIRKHIFDFCQAKECSPFPNLGKFWASSFGGWVGEKPVGDVGPFDAQNVGVLVGSDFYCGEGVSLGAVGGYTRSFLQWEDHGGGGSLNSYYGALYGSWREDRATVDFSLIGGATSQELARNLMFSSINRKAKSDFWGQFFTLHGGVEGIYVIKTLECRPYATADYNYWHQNAFQEEGADSLNLNVLSKLQLFMRGEAGVRLFWEMKGDKSCFSPYLGLSWVGDFPLKDSNFRATFIDQQPIMDVTSYGRSQQMGSPQGGLQYTHCSGIRAMVGYKGFFNRDLNINDFEARMDWKF